nr:class I SAM-dependent methyltransferase [Oceanococcus sp. HetDA_MAG_MS8]
MTDLPTLHCALDPQDPVAAQCQHAADSPWILTRDIEGRLNLKDDRQPRQRPLIIDFHSDDIRRRISGGRKDLLARALGYKKAPWQVLDLTGGLGRDAATCAGLGMQVTVFERNPVLAMLLQEAIQRAPEAMAHNLCWGGHQAAPDDWRGAQAVMYDPMYPGSGNHKGAAPGLQTQQLRALVGHDEDVEHTFASLRAHPPKRLAIKRPPRGQRVQLGEPSLSMRGGRVHWDIYLAP